MGLSALPTPLRHCRKCGDTTPFNSSGLFRVNAQGKCLDVWLIYKCIHCDATWNMTIYTRVRPGSLDPMELEGFHANDPALAEKFAGDLTLIRQNGAETGPLEVEIHGEPVSFDEPCMVTIHSSFPVRLAEVLRKKLNLSRRAYDLAVAEGGITSPRGLDLRKGRFSGETQVMLGIEKK